ncbi:MAG: aldehyde dehydrogenase family protein [Anaerolineae bacterium]|nr:aldehyde dehydrogenase family protein [Anaerolineae bacterium]
MKRYQLLIDGEWRDPISGKWTPNVNPANTDDVIGEFASAGVEDVNLAVEAAKRAFPGWRGMPMVKRGDILYKAANLLEARLEEVAQAMTREEGKTLPEARGETARGVAILRYFAGEASQPDGETYPTALPNRMLYTRREPVGVIGMITPWNFPVAIPLWKVAPALIYGNTVLIKSAEITPLTAWHIVDVLVQAGIPRGVINLVTGSGRVAGNAMVGHPDVKAISFTGSNSVGRGIQRQMFERGAKAQLEMGGKNPVVVMDDASLDIAVEMVVRGAMRSTGQKCTATSRVFVQKGIFKTFSDALVERVKGLRVGDGMDANTYLGPAVSKDQQQTVLDYLEIGRQEGAKVGAGGAPLSGGMYDKGYFVPPTVFLDADVNSRLMQEEIFGPVVALAAINNLDDAIEAANNVPFGLSASIISQDVGKIMRFIDGIQAGLVHVNDETAGAEPQVPFGGFKESSSHSREQGKAAREFYTQIKTVYLDYPA